MTDTPWMTRNEAAERLRVSPKTIDRYARDGLLTRHVLPDGGDARYRKTEVDALIQRVPAEDLVTP